MLLCQVTLTSTHDFLDILVAATVLGGSVWSAYRHRENRLKQEELAASLKEEAIQTAVKLSKKLSGQFSKLSSRVDITDHKVDQIGMHMGITWVNGAKPRAQLPKKPRAKTTPVK